MIEGVKVSTMKIAIVGYGKMGHEISTIATARGMSCVTIDPKVAEADFKDISLIQVA